MNLTSLQIVFYALPALLVVAVIIFFTFGMWKEDDDSKLKVIFYTIVVLGIVAVIGLWESFVKPFIGFLIDNISFR